VLATVIVLGMFATVWGSIIDGYDYRETVSPWFRGIFTLQPQEELIAGARFVLQAHALVAWLLFAIWPFTRLVHVWSVPLAYFGRSPILYRSRTAGPAERATQSTKS
jgi:nitrate reductase gamma subunit